MGANRDKFLFIGGLGRLNSGDPAGCISDMKEVVKNYPGSRISEMAGMIVNGVEAGKRLRGGKFDLDNVWNYRSNVLNDSDSIQQARLSPERDIDFRFLLVYHPDSLNENKLLFELARFNFTNFLVRNFEIEIQDFSGLHQMQVSGFRSFDEAYQYARQLFASKAVVQQMGRTAKGIIISDKNLRLIGSAYSYKDYEAFYAKHFAPLTVTRRYLLSEPAEVATPRERDLQQEIEQKQGNVPDLYPDTQDVPADNTMTIPLDVPKPVKTEQKTEERNGSVFEIPVEETKSATKKETATEDGNTYVIPEERPVKPATPAKPAIPVRPSVPASSVRPVKPVVPRSPEKPAAQKPQPDPARKKPVDDGPVIYFGDDESQQDKNKPNSKNNKKKQPVQPDIEDEYYDLEGF